MNQHRWGDGLFENQDDLARVRYLDRLLMVTVEEEVARSEEHEKAGGEARTSIQSSAVPFDSASWPEDGMRYTIFRHLCSHHEKVRKYVDEHWDQCVYLINTHDMDVAQRQSQAREESKIGYNPSTLLMRNGPLVLLFGLCAMTLGCTLTTELSETLDEIYGACVENVKVRDSFFLTSKGLRQLDSALHGPRLYQTGSPYTFNRYTDFWDRAMVKLSGKQLLVTDSEVSHAIKKEGNDEVGVRYHGMCGLCGKSKNESEDDAKDTSGDDFKHDYHDDVSDLFWTETRAINSRMRLICGRHIVVNGTRRARRLLKSIVECVDAIKTSEDVDESEEVLKIESNVANDEEVERIVINVDDDNDEDG